MTIAQIECFLEIVNKGSMTKAAEYLFITQQAASKHIQAIEKELGFSVFERNRKGITLTEEGKILFEEWTKLYEIYRISVDKAHDLHVGKDKIIRIGIADMGYCTDDIFATFGLFEDRYPDLSIEYQIMTPREMYFAFQSREIDLAICYISEFEGIHSFHVLPLQDQNIEVGVFMSKKHPLARADVTMADLTQVPIGVLGVGNSMDFEIRMHQFFAHYNLKYQGEFRQYSSRRYLEIALSSGRCIAIVYSTMFPTDQSRFFYKKLDLEDLSSRIGLFWLTDENRNKARSLAELLQEQFERR